MDDNELSDGMEELQQLIAEYEEKETKMESVKETHNVPTKIKSKRVKKLRNKSSKVNLIVPMDKVIFGDKQGFIESLTKSIGEPTTNYIEFTENQNTVEGECRNKRKRKPAWIDADDEQIQVGEVKKETKFTGPLDHLKKDKTYKEYLTSRFTRIVAQPKWAQLDRKKAAGEDDSDEEILGTVGFLGKPSTNVLAPNHIHYKRLKDLNRATYAEGSISSVQFHPTSTAALVAGQRGISTIYSIDGQQNEKLHNILFKNFMIRRARITPCGTKAIFGSNKNYYYLYDLLTAQEMRFMLPSGITKLTNFELSPCGRYMAVAGRFGALHLFDAKSQELLHSFKQEDDVAGICFTSTSQRLVCSSVGSTVSIYSIRAQRMEHNFYDDGCISGRTMGLAPNQRLLATGSREGVVNVYDFEQVQKLRNPLPEKSFYNLRTSIADVKFNQSSELLAMCSSDVKSAVKLAHFPSGTVYSNFPGFQNDIGQVHTMAFSPNSGYLALGTRTKEVRLIRLKYFKNY